MCVQRDGTGLRGEVRDEHCRGAVVVCSDTRPATASARADQEFHQTLAEAADNAVLLDLLHAVRSLLQVCADRAVQDQAAERHALREHEAVLAAVVRGDEDLAAGAMAAHMATATTRLRTDVEAADLAPSSEPGPPSR